MYRACGVMNLSNMRYKGASTIKQSFSVQTIGTFGYKRKFVYERFRDSLTIFSYIKMAFVPFSSSFWEQLNYNDYSHEKDKIANDLLEKKVWFLFFGSYLQ